MTTTEITSTAFAVEVVAVTDIDAPPAEVWAVLADTARYPEWNPFVRRLDGALEVGERLGVALQLPGRATPRAFTALNDALAARVTGRVQGA